MNVVPNSTFEATTSRFAAGATVGVRIRDNQGNDTLARTTVGVTEDVTVGASCVKRRTFAAISTAGQYTIVWDDGINVDTEELLVTSDAAAVGGTSNLYISAVELKASLNLSGTTFADDDVDLAIPSACRAIDTFMRKSVSGFYPTEGLTRYYEPDRYATEVEIDDLITVDAVSVDRNGDLTYSETWEEGVDFFLDPPNAYADGLPYKRLVLRRTAGRTFPPFQRSVMIDATFGWPETPSQVKQAAKILATQLVNRRDVPFGIITAGSEMVAMARLGRIDPHVAWLLGQIPGEQRPALRSLQLG